MDDYSQQTEPVRQLFQKHVPEVASGIVEIKNIAREIGVRSLVVVSAAEGAVWDTVGACIGPRGNRCAEIVRELGGEQIEVVRWSDSVEDFIRNLMAPHRVAGVAFDDATRRATVAVRPLSTPLPPGAEVSEAVQAAKLRLASRFVGWDLQLEVSNAR